MRYKTFTFYRKIVGHDEQGRPITVTARLGKGRRADHIDADITAGGGGYLYHSAREWQYLIGASARSLESMGFTRDQKQYYGDF